MDASKNPVVFFDLDNCLYPSSLGIQQLMVERIERYCVEVLHMSPEEAKSLHQQYFKDYGLAIRGLLKHHKVDPAHYDAYVDGGLPLQDYLKPDPRLRQLLLDCNLKKYVFTNAGIHHAERVL